MAGIANHVLNLDKLDILLGPVGESNIENNNAVSPLNVPNHVPTYGQTEVVEPGEVYISSTAITEKT